MKKIFCTLFFASLFSGAMAQKPWATPASQEWRDSLEAWGNQRWITIGGGGGTVTTVTGTDANGIGWTITNPTTTPDLTITLGDITPSSVVSAGIVTGSNLSGTNTGDQTSIVGITGTLAEFNTALTGADFASGGGTATGTNTGDQTITLTGNVTGSGTGSFATTIAAGVVTNAMLAGSIAYSKLVLTGAILNADLAGSIAASKLVGTDIATVGTLTAGSTGTGFTVDLSTSTINGDLLYANITPSANASRFLGRTSASAGDWQECSYGANLVMTGTVLSASDATVTTANEATDVTCFPTFVVSATGSQGIKTNAGLTFNSNTAALGATIMNATTLTATTINGNTFTTGTGVLTIGAAKTLTVNNTLTLAGTDGTTMTFPATSATIARTDAANTFTGIQTFSSDPIIPDEAYSTSWNGVLEPPTKNAIFDSRNSTAGVGACPTSSSTQTITHNLGYTPTIIRIYGVGRFTASTSATPTPFSNGIWNSSGNFCVYMTTAGTSTQDGLSSNTFSVFIATSSGNTMSGVIGNVTSTQFDIVWTETGTAAALPYMWEAGN